MSISCVKNKQVVRGDKQEESKPLLDKSEKQIPRKHSEEIPEIHLDIR